MVKDREYDEEIEELERYRRWGKELDARCEAADEAAAPLIAEVYAKCDAYYARQRQLALASLPWWYRLLIFLRLRDIPEAAYETVEKAI